MLILRIHQGWFLIQGAPASVANNTFLVTLLLKGQPVTLLIRKVYRK